MPALSRTTLCVLASLCAATPSIFAQPDEAHKQKAERLIVKSIDYLCGQQDKDKGGWAIPPEGPAYPAITGLVINGMLMQPGASHEDEAIAKGINFLLRNCQADGGIYDKVLPSYNTALSTSALARVPREDAKSAVKAATEFLRKLQWSEAALPDKPGETGRVDASHTFYGGVGYGRHGRPDNSNLAFFLDAMHSAGVDSNDPAFQRALVFLSRTQMLDSTNDRPYADGSSQGGFIYATGVNKDRIADGQSPAGEIAESLSGPPGTVAHVVLKKLPDGKDHTLTKQKIQAQINEASGSADAAALKDGVVIVLGVSSDGLTANTFEVRTPIGSPQVLKDVLAKALASDVADADAIRVEPAEHWKGVSRLRAYGSMSYAGFKGLIYAGLKRDDPRVVAAYDWIRSNYTLRVNPGLGTDGLYYYLVTFSRAMDAWGEQEISVVVSPASGSPTVERRNWANDLIDRLAELQNDDGSFRSVDDRWMENNPVLITAYGLLALQHAAR